MRYKDYLFGVLAGFFVVLLFYVNEIFYIIGPLFIQLLCPIVSSVLAIILIHHKQNRFVAAKFGIFLGSAFVFIHLFMPFSSDVLVNIYDYYNPDCVRGYFGSLTGLGSVALRFAYLVINGASLLVYLVIVIPYNYVRQKSEEVIPI